MSLRDTLKREAEVAFSKKWQSVPVRILKYVILLALVFIFWSNLWFWRILIILLVISLIVHFSARYKTKGWTQDYGLWKIDRKGERKVDG